MLSYEDVEGNNTGEKNNHGHLLKEQQMIYTRQSGLKPPAKNTRGK